MHGNITDLFKVLIGNPEAKRPLGKPISWTG
jgi:hypothetical protein